MNSDSVGIAVLAGLLILAGIIGRSVATHDEPAKEEIKAEPRPNTIVAANKDFPAFTLLQQGDVVVRKGTDGSPEPDVSTLTNRYLLVGVRRGGEVKVENVAALSATDVLNDSTAVTIPASPATSLGGQLRVGELVEVTAVSGKEDASIIKVDKVVVLSIVPPNKEGTSPGSITLAVANSQRDDFTRAISRTPYFVTRKIEVNKPNPGNGAQQQTTAASNPPSKVNQ